MGLAEKRATMEFQKNVYPNLKKAIDEAAGFEVPIQVDWASLAQPDDAAIYQDYWTKIYFEPLLGAVKSICADDLGKAALKESLKRIEICNSGQFSNPQGFSFDAGVLRLDHKLVNADNVQERTDGLLEKVQAAL
jgi:hypothetical protein